MLAEKLDERSNVIQRQRLQAFTQTEVWKQDIKPFLLEKLTAAKSGIFYSEEDSIHWKSIGIYAHIEEMLEFVEEIQLEKVLWEKWEKWEKKEKENQEPKPKLSLRNWWRKRKKAQQ